MVQQNINLAWSGAIGPATTHTRTNYFRPEIYIELLKMIEASGFGFAVLTEAVRPTLNPVVLAGAVSNGITTLGIVPEVLTTDYPPFKVGRLIGTLQHLSQGRAGWLIDTSLDRGGAHNYGLGAPPPQDLQNEIAEEYLEVCTKLWNSWEAGSLLEDAEEGVFGDATKVSPIHHQGKHFRVRGPLNLMMTQFGLPLLVQRVKTENDIDFAARHADVALLTVSDADDVVRAADGLRERARRHGRPSSALKIYVSATLRVGETEDARATWNAVDDAVVIAGNSEDAADRLERLFDASSYDGLNICGNFVPLEVNAVCNRVIASLRRRGRIRTGDPALSLRQRVLG